MPDSAPVSVPNAPLMPVTPPMRLVEPEASLPKTPASGPPASEASLNAAGRSEILPTFGNASPRVDRPFAMPEMVDTAPAASLKASAMAMPLMSVAASSPWLSTHSSTLETRLVTTGIAAESAPPMTLATSPKALPIAPVKSPICCPWSTIHCSALEMRSANIDVALSTPTDITSEKELNLSPSAPRIFEKFSAAEVSASLSLSCCRVLATPSSVPLKPSATRSRTA